LQWLNEERLIQRLTELMHTGRDEEVEISLTLLNVSPPAHLILVMEVLTKTSKYILFSLNSSAETI